MILKMLIQLIMRTMDTDEQRHYDHLPEKVLSLYLPSKHLSPNQESNLATQTVNKYVSGCQVI